FGDLQGLVEEDMLAEGAVSAPKVKNKAIKARHRTMEDLENLVPEGEFENFDSNAEILDIWNITGGAIGTNFWLFNGDTETGKQCLVLDNLVLGGNDGGAIPSLNMNTSHFPVKKNQSLAWSVTIRTTDVASATGFYY